jgi:predicted nucleotidyltransferase
MTEALPATLPKPMVESFVKWARRHPQINRVWAIGSRAKGTAREDSDLDLALEFVPEMDCELAELIQKRKRWGRELTRRLGVLVKDIQLANDPGDGTYGAVQDHGVKIYEKKHR